MIVNKKEMEVIDLQMKLDDLIITKYTQILNQKSDVNNFSTWDLAKDMLKFQIFWEKNEWEYEQWCE